MLLGLTIVHGKKRSLLSWVDESETFSFSVDLDENGHLESTFEKQRDENSLPRRLDLNAPKYAKIREALLEFLGDGTLWAEGRANIRRQQAEKKAAELLIFRQSLIDAFKNFRRPDFVAIVAWLTDEQLRTMRTTWQEQCRPSNLSLQAHRSFEKLFGDD
jgi:hypothetical protein